MSIEVSNLTYIYNKGTAFEKVAIDNISFTIETGEFVGLIGHTGSGKSTLIQHFNSLIKPTSGKIMIDGVDINADKSKLKHYRQRVGLVFQYPEHQLFEMTVYKDVAFGPENMGLDKNEVNRRVEDALEIVGIEKSLFEKSPFELSGGQKRRVAIAGVLAMKPDYLILDEPTAGLDPRGRDEILSEIKLMHDRLNITICLVSHSMEDVSRLVDKIIVLHKGHIAYMGTPVEVFANVTGLEEIGLAAPRISYLMHELRKSGLDVSQDVFTAEAAKDEIMKLLKRV